MYGIRPSLHIVDELQVPTSSFVPTYSISNYLSTKSVMWTCLFQIPSPLDDVDPYLLGKYFIHTTLSYIEIFKECGMFLILGEEE